MRLADKWSASYARQTGNQLFDIELGTYIYTFDTAASRLVCVRGHSTAPSGPRDASRQKGHPSAPQGDHKGHAAFEYGYDHPESGFQVEYFDNPRSS